MVAVIQLLCIDQLVVQLRHLNLLINGLTKITSRIKSGMKNENTE